MESGPAVPEVAMLDYNKAEQYSDALDLWPPYCNPSYIMPEVIEVRITNMNGRDKEQYSFPVQVIKAASDSKPYLGGFRNKANGVVYHHGNTQTPTDSKKPKKINNTATSRDTQTYEVRSLSVQPYRESGTQMERPDLRLDNNDEKYMVSKPYFTSESLLHLKKEKTIEIQRYWRGYMARIRADQIRQRNHGYNQSIEDAKQAEKDELLQNAKETLARRTNPKTNSDFALLYNELDSWRKAEIAKIKGSGLSGEKMKLAMNDLLASETKALQSMQRLKLEAQRDVHSEKTMAMLSEMSKPQQWQLSKGEIAIVATPETLRAKELLDLYQQLILPVTKVDTRLEILLNVKWVFHDYDTSLTRDIKDLIDREADLLNRGRKIDTMSNLRTRLKNLFLEFIQDPDYNPRAADFLTSAIPA